MAWAASAGARGRRALAIAGLVAAALVPAAAGAELRLLDRIVAVVDDDVVLASELENRMRFIERQFESNDIELPPREVLTRQVLERLILDSIQLQMGRRAGIRISDEELTRAIAGIARSNNMGVEQFRRALAADGLRYVEFREQIRREMIIARVQQNRVNDRIYITPQEVENFMDSPVGEAATADEFRVGHILLAVTDDASEEAVAAARREAERLHERLEDGADFAQLAVAHSDGQRALEGGDLGWRKPGQLPSLLADPVMEAEEGEVLEPIRSASGFHLVKVLDKRGAGTGVVRQTHVRHILVQPSEIRSEEEARRLIHEVHRRLEQGASFEQLARDHSDDPGSALSGGDLGWVSPEQMVPAFAERMREAEAGEVVGPFESEFGWHVLEVLGRRQQDMSKQFRERQAMELLRKRRFDEELQAWLAEIRDEAYVEIKI